MDPGVHREARRRRAARGPEVDMRWILAVAIVVLVAACSQKKDEPTIQYAAPRAPLGNEASAAGAAAATLAGGLAPLDTTAASQPEYGLPGLADQLAAQLGTAGVAELPGASAKLAQIIIKERDLTRLPQLARQWVVISMTNSNTMWHLVQLRGRT
jgi:hypothetical protein